LMSYQQAALKSYPPSAQQAITSAFSNEANTRLAEDFTTGFENSVIADIVIFALVFVLVAVLPQPKALRNSTRAEA
jgi:hypothetical protein